MTKPTADSSGLKVRRARQADAARIAALSGQLGYPASAKQMAGRLKSVLRQKNGVCFVAESNEGALIGWVHVSVTPLLEVELRSEINGLVVDERARSRGAGAQLMDTAEKWAKKMRSTAMSVRSNVLRDRAHEFYQRQGYKHYKTQKAFLKPL